LTNQGSADRQSSKQTIHVSWTLLDEKENGNDLLRFPQESEFTVNFKIVYFILYLTDRFAKRGKAIQ
jgi:hypothetical protein